MNHIVIAVLVALGATAVGYGSFSALGQSAQSQSVQPGPWQLMVSPTSPPFAWKLNTLIGAAYFCQGAQTKCVRMNDEPSGR
jgi:hypothetical protein